MRECFFFLFLILIAACNASVYNDIDKTIMDRPVKNFGLFDHTGDFHRLHYYSDAKAIVLYVQGNACPIVRKSIQKLNELQKEYEEKGFRFFMINSNLQDDRVTIAEEAKSFGINMPVWVDENQLAADLLDIRITAETFVIDPTDWKILYRGPVDDQLGYGSDRGEAKVSHLKNVLDSLVQGNTVTREMIPTKGCAIARLKDIDDDEQLNYVDDVAPLLQSKCVRCHHEEGIAPWAMNSYASVVGWSAMMREVLTSRIMPPWQADPHIGTFANDLSLKREELRKIISWIDMGRQRGEGPDPLENAINGDDAWSLGEPDEIMQLEEEMIPKTGIIDYRHQEFKVDFTEDKYLRAVEVKPGNPNVLHHVLARVQYPDGQDHPVKIRGSEWLDGLLLGWAPGGGTEIFPEGTGRKIPAGSAIIFQLHYTTTGKEESDITQIGMYFHERIPEKEYVIHGPADFNMEIPPHAPRHPVTAFEKFDRPVTLYAMLPHMHYRGKSMKYVANYPDGRKEVILSVPDYNFNWQRFYYLQEPLDMPAGTVLSVHALFDNSAQNEFNPDPSKTLYFGRQTFDEMMIGYISFTYADEPPSAPLSSL